MATGHTDTEQAVLNMLQRYGMMTMDEILTSRHPDFSWAQVFLAIDRLSRSNMIVLSRTGGTYQLALSKHGLPTMSTSKEIRRFIQNTEPPRIVEPPWNAAINCAPQPLSSEVPSIAQDFLGMSDTEHSIWQLRARRKECAGRFHDGDSD